MDPADGNAKSANCDTDSLAGDISSNWELGTDNLDCDSNDVKLSQTIRLTNSMLNLETDMSHDLESTAKSGIKFSEKKLEHDFQRYWQLRYGLAMKTSLYMMLTLMCVTLCIDNLLIKTVSQSILTIILLFIISTCILIVNSTNIYVEKIVCIAINFILIYFIIQFTLLETIDNFKFISYYICIIVFCNGFVHFRVKYYQRMCYGCFILFNMIVFVRLIVTPSFLDVTDISNWFGQNVAILFVTVEFLY